MLGSKRRLGLESCRDIWSGCVYNAREAGRAVRKENFGLADPAGVKQQLPRAWVARVVLVVEPGVQVAKRHPGRLAAPTGLDKAGAKR